MTQKFSLILGGILTSSLLVAMPATAQITDAKVDSLVEALRLAAPDTGTEDDGLYSEWQIKPDNIPRWSKLCIQQELTPAEFEANEAQAREVLSCVMSDILQEEYEASGNDESLAVRRAAAWWMAGDPEQYNSERISDYTQEVLQHYQQQ
ncbi:hypothetical protein [Laspinema olomoucense]|uniref:Uncharacterized protein n=2 Tax=Laspinema TaxID=2584823 RepID=A0ABT2NC27_9CYAN|nr:MULTISPECIES: hypothetical protein [unclassified Laspinema]MCT7980117.1 hypothetical protein [Laspinema sp. D3b]MCT7996364.1 hypothetical protein [Laspinema sp. D3c]